MDELPDLIQALKSKGFSPSATSLGEIRFSGEVTIEGLRIPLLLTFESKHLVDFPVIKITGWLTNAMLRTSLGIRHIAKDGCICYIDTSRTVWDATQAIPYVLASLIRVIEILEENIKGSSPPEDIMRDFSGYWGSSDKLYLTTELQTGQLLFERIGRNHRWLAASSDTEYSGENDKGDSRSWIAVALDEPPVPSIKNWPPENLRQLINWLEQSNRSIPRTITRFLVEIARATPQANGFKHKSTLSKSIGLILYWKNPINSQIYHASVTFELPDQIASALLHRRIIRITKMLRAATPVAILRQSVIKSDPEHIIYRNIPVKQTSLEGMRILLVGAGAIGGFLAHHLTSFGAGWGEGGILTIVDNDSFSPDNVGRHFLGMDSVGEPKAKALKDKLKSSFPYLTINAETVSIFDKTKLLAGKSLIVNATGMQTVGIGLEKVMRSYYPQAPLLHSWIYGHGLAVQAILNDWSGHACFRCLWHQNMGSSEFSPKYPVAKDPDAEAPLFGPCHESFYPYPISAAVSAANQAFMLIADWLSGDPGDRFRTTILQPDKCHSVADASIKSVSSCPLCHAQ